MPLYLDRHELEGVTAADVAAAHLKDLEVQEDFDVRFLTYWFDYDRQLTFCLARGPNREAIDAAHGAAHGLVPNQVIEVDERDVERFLGVVDHPPGEPYVATAFRAILFTDIEGSTRLTQELGDARAMAVLRQHDRIVEAALARTGGSEVKHTGDGVMASFVSAVSALRAAIDIQRAVAEAGQAAMVPRVRVGVSAGEPVTERDDLFGAAVQLAARLCQHARPATILVSTGVQALALGKGFAFGRRRTLRLKGFDESTSAVELEWESAAEVGPAIGA